MACRVCRKEYYCCSDSKTSNAWKAVACSEECYKKYMKRIETVRKSKKKQVKNGENMS